MTISFRRLVTTIAIVLATSLATSVATNFGVQPAEATERRHPTGLSFGIIVGGPPEHKPAQQRAKHTRDHLVQKSCSTEQASHMARAHGIQFQTIYRNRNTITVTGFRNGHRARMGFSRAPDCRRTH